VAAFAPLRRWVQGLVDRRLNRRRYDAERTVAGFAARRRGQLDLDALAAELLAVVDQTVQPTQARLWLRPSPAHGPTAVAPGAAQPSAEPGRASRRPAWVWRTNAAFCQHSGMVLAST
jgi:hypothetical protein